MKQQQMSLFDTLQLANIVCKLLTGIDHMHYNCGVA